MNHSFDIEITSYCQAFCTGCSRNDIFGNPDSLLVNQHMSYENFCKLIDTINAHSKPKYIEFCGEFGDPIMHPHLQKFIEKVLENTYLVVHTNGGLRQPKWFLDMAKLYGKKMHIKFGIDGCDHDTNWKYRKGVNWQRAIDNLTAWTQAGGAGHWDFLLFDWNYHQIPQAIQMANDIGCKLNFSITEDDNGIAGMSYANIPLAKEILKHHREELINLAHVLNIFE